MSEKIEGTNKLEENSEKPFNGAIVSCDFIQRKLGLTFQEFLARYEDNGPGKDYTGMDSLNLSDREQVRKLNEFMNQCRVGNYSVVISLDMNGMKGINDKFGYPDGNLSIELTSKLIRAIFDYKVKSNTTYNEIPRKTEQKHTKGDEFYLFATDLYEHEYLGLVEIVRTIKNESFVEIIPNEKDKSNDTGIVQNKVASSYLSISSCMIAIQNTGVPDDNMLLEAEYKDNFYSLYKHGNEFDINKLISLAEFKWRAISKSTDLREFFRRVTNTNSFETLMAFFREQTRPTIAMTLIIAFATFIEFDLNYLKENMPTQISVDSLASRKYTQDGEWIVKKIVLQMWDALTIKPINAIRAILNEGLVRESDLTPDILEKIKEGKNRMSRADIEKIIFSNGLYEDSMVQEWLIDLIDKESS